jgi:transposase
VQGAQAVIPPRKNHKQPRRYDKAIYKLRHLVEDAFLHLKRWRGIATQYAKNAPHSLLPCKFAASLPAYLLTTLSGNPDQFPTGDQRG